MEIKDIIVNGFELFYMYQMLFENFTAKYIFMFGFWVIMPCRFTSIYILQGLQKEEALHGIVIQKRTIKIKGYQSLHIPT